MKHTLIDPVCRDLTINAATENQNEDACWDEGNVQAEEMMVEMQERRDDGGGGGLSGEKLFWYSAATGGHSSQTNHYIDDETQKFNSDGW